MILHWKSHAIILLHLALWRGPMRKQTDYNACCNHCMHDCLVDGRDDSCTLLSPESFSADWKHVRVRRPLQAVSRSVHWWDVISSGACQPLSSQTRSLHHCRRRREGILDTCVAVRSVNDGNDHDKMARITTRTSSSSSSSSSSSYFNRPMWWWYTLLAPEYLTRACVLLSTLYDRPHLRSSEDNKLFVPRSLTASIGPLAFCSSGPTSLNTVPFWLRGSSLTLKQFKCLLKASLFAWLSPHAPYWQFSVICAFWSVCLLLLLLFLTLGRYIPEGFKKMKR